MFHECIVLQLETKQTAVMPHPTRGAEAEFDVEMKVGDRLCKLSAGPQQIHHILKQNNC